MDNPGSAASDDSNEKASADHPPHLADGARLHRARPRVLPPGPPEELNRYIAPRSPWRRRRDWPALVIALVVSAIVFVGCCIAGFALANGNLFK
jgi:hypothetical protein